MFLHRLLAEEVIDAENLVLVDNAEDFFVERARRRKVGAKGLFDDDAAKLVLALFRQPGLAEPFDNWPEELRRGGEIEDHVLVALAFRQLVEMLSQTDEHVVVGDVAGVVVDAREEPSLGFLVDFLLARLAVGRFDDLDHRLQKIGAERFLIGIAAIDAEDREILVQETLVHEIVDRRHQEALCEIAGCAEDHEDARRGDHHAAGSPFLDRHLVHLRSTGVVPCSTWPPNWKRIADRIFSPYV